MVAGDRPATLQPQPDFPTNRGGLCSKGWTAATLLDHPQRLLTPLVRIGAGGPEQRVPAGLLGRGARPRRRGIRRTQAAYGRGRGRLLRRRRADQREGLRLRQVRPGRAADGHDRLQRPVLHVVRGHSGQPGLRHRPRTALPAGRHRRGRGDPAGRLQPRGHHAAGHAVVRRGAGRRRHPHRGRPAPHRHRGRLVGAPGARCPAPISRWRTVCCTWRSRTA